MTKKYSKATEDIYAHYLDSEGEAKLIAGIALLNQLTFADTNLEMARKILREIVGLPSMQEKHLSEQVKELIAVTDGWFSVTDVYRELHVVTPTDKTNVRVTIKRLYDAGRIEKHGERNGVYRKPHYDCEKIDILNASDEPLKIKFPLDLHDYICLYPGDVAVIAGKWNSGKSGFLLEMARLNMNDFDIHFFTSEMKGPRFKKRIKKMDDITLEDFAKKVHIFGREGMFQDVIQPNAMNLIDYLQINEDFYRVGAHIREIAEKLEKGVAIVALQKDAGASYGYGAQKGLQRPMLYLTIDDGVLKVVKAKDWVGESNPNGKIMKFKLVNGIKFIPQTDLHYEEDDPKNKQWGFK